MNSTHSMTRPDESNSAMGEFYTPLHTKRKVFMVVVGLLIFAYGSSELAPPLLLVLKGKHTTGEATQVVKTKSGLPDQFFSNEVGLNAGLEKRDRSYIFWNEFRFSTPDGAEHTVRMPIGSQLKPIFPLLDSDGLPTTVPIDYDPKEPERVCVPNVLSTWFAPGLITFMGAVCTAFGCLILYWSRHRIEIHF